MLINFPITSLTQVVTVIPDNGARRSLYINYNGPVKPNAINGVSLVCQNQQAVPYSIPLVSGATSYTWNGPSGSRFSDGITTSATSTYTTSSTSVTVNFKTTPGYIKVNANNSCGSGPYLNKSITFNCRDVQLIELDNQSVTVFPNPSHEVINVSINLKKDEMYTLKIMDLTGRLLFTFQKAGVTGDNVTQIDLSKWIKGIYILEVNSPSFNNTIRQIVN